MNKKVFILFLLFMFGIFSAGVVAAPTGEVRAQQAGLPNITFLGQGPGTFSVEPPLKLLVKTYENGQFLFVTHDENTYRAGRNERVWSTDWMPAESIRLFDEGRSYGQVPAGCVVNYVQIEDNPDTRRNTFYLDGEVLQVVEQGWVTYGSFTIPKDGELSFFAEDSVGLIVTPCPPSPGEATPTTPVDESPTPTTPVEETATPTTPAGPTETATTPAEGPTPTNTPPSVIVTELPSPTPTGTGVPPAGPTPTNTPPSVIVTAAPSATPTNPNVPPAAPTATRTPAPGAASTRTPAPTAGAIPVSGGEPGPREMAGMGLGLLGGLALLAAAWRALLRASRVG